MVRRLATTARRSRRLHAAALVLVLGLAFVRPASAVLIDHGSDGAYFRDTATGLYWFDPERFLGSSLADVQGFVASSPIWSWAKPAQIDALNGKSSGGVPLENVMGARQYTLLTGGPRWLGYIDPADFPPIGSAEPDGWLVQAAVSDDTIDDTGFQGDAAQFLFITGVGAWLVSTIDPMTQVPLPATSALLAGALLAGALQRKRAAGPSSRIATVNFGKRGQHPNL